MDALRGIMGGAEGNVLNVLIVGHAGVNRLVVCDVLGIPAANLHSIGQDYGCLNIIEFAETSTRLRLLNFTPPAERVIAEIVLDSELQRQEVD